VTLGLTQEKTMMALETNERKVTCLKPTYACNQRFRYVTHTHTHTYIKDGKKNPTFFGQCNAFLDLMQLK